MQQNNQNQSNINPNTKPYPLASEQVRVVQKKRDFVRNGYGSFKEQIGHAANACEVFGLDLKRHRQDVNFTVELVDGSIWIPSTANLRVIATTYQCIRMPDTLRPRRAPVLLVSNGKHSSIGAYASDYATSLEV